MKKTFRNNGFVYKIDNSLDNSWREKLERIMKVIELPAFVGFVEGGYVTKYINGIDLQDDPPFLHRHDEVRSYALNKKQRRKIIKLFKSVVKAGRDTGLTLADFTKRNILLHGDTPYLIDYDVIIEGELPQDYIALFQKMLDYLKIEYQFKGDLKELYECLA